MFYRLPPSAWAKLWLWLMFLDYMLGSSTHVFFEDDFSHSDDDFEDGRIYVELLCLPFLTSWMGLRYGLLIGDFSCLWFLEEICSMKFLYEVGCGLEGFITIIFLTDWNINIKYHMKGNLKRPLAMGCLDLCYQGWVCNFYRDLNHNECSNFLEPCRFLTILKTSIFLSISCWIVVKLAWSFLRFCFSFLSSLWAFLSNLPMDLVELWAAANWPLIYFFTYFNFPILLFLLASSLYFLDNFFPFSSFCSFWLPWFAFSPLLLFIFFIVDYYYYIIFHQ